MPGLKNNKFETKKLLIRYTKVHVHPFLFVERCQPIGTILKSFVFFSLSRVTLNEVNHV